MEPSLKNIGDRLKQYLKFKNIKVNEFAKSIHTSSTQISNIINGKNFGMIKLIDVINACPDLNLIWLIQGKDKMLYDNVKSQNSNKLENDDKSNDCEELLEINKKILHDLDILKLQNKSLEGTISYQSLTIEAYKNSIEIVSSTNHDLKDIIKFYKTIVEDTSKQRKIA